MAVIKYSDLFNKPAFGLIKNFDYKGNTMAEAKKFKILTKDIQVKTGANGEYLLYRFTTDEPAISEFVLFGTKGTDKPRINKREIELNVGDQVQGIWERVGKDIKMLELQVTEVNTKELKTKLTNEGMKVEKQDTKVSTSSSKKNFTVRGTIYYAHVKEKDTKGLYPSNAYKLDLSIDDEHVKALTALGVQIKNKGDEKGNFVTLKSKEYQPRVKGVNGEDITGQTLIGNGSTATITTMLYDNTEANVRAGKGGKKLLGLGTIQLENLVEYQAQPLV